MPVIIVLIRSKFGQKEMGKVVYVKLMLKERKQTQWSPSSYLIARTLHESLCITAGIMDRPVKPSASTHLKVVSIWTYNIYVLRIIFSLIYMIFCESSVFSNNVNGFCLLKVCVILFEPPGLCSSFLW
jgi:hypothetical protein